VSGSDDTSGWLDRWIDGGTERPDPPPSAYSAEEFTAPLTPVPAEPAVDDAATQIIPPLYDDERPTTVIPAVTAGAGLSPEQDALLAQLRSRRSAGRRAAGPRQAGRRAAGPRQAARLTVGALARPRARHSLLLRALVTAGAFTVTLALTGVAIAGALYAKYDHQLHRVAVLQQHDPNIREATRQLTAENFLVIGSDSRAGLSRSFGIVPGARSDTTMLVHIAPDHTKATIISIPRDSWVQLPACRNTQGKTVAAHADMFNAAFAIGGAACTIATVQKLTGIAVTHYVELNFSGFQAMVNAIGAVTVCSPEAVYDPGSGLRLRKGDNHLGGAQALAYVRARESLGDGSDLGRIKRQQMFLGDVLRQAMSGPILSNPARLTSFLDAATKAITIDKSTSIGDLRTLATSLRGLDPAHVTFYTAPIADPNYSPPGTTMTGRVLLDAKRGQLLYDSVINDKQPVWVTGDGSSTTVVAGPSGAPTPGAPTPGAPTSGAPTSGAPTSGSSAPPAAALPKPNLNAAQQTCSL
jgi:LCP family protein required for cell wall assembly